MARLIYALNQSLDGFVDHDKFEPDEALFQHFIEDVAALDGAIYGRTMYEVMRYWDEEHEKWGDPERDYARAWRAMPKWVVSTTLSEVGPNATLLEGDAETAIRELKDSHDGDIEIAGPVLAGSMAASGVIDEYRIYLHATVVGGEKPFFVQQPPRLHLTETERIGPEVVRLTYIPV